MQERQGERRDAEAAAARRRQWRQFVLRAHLRGDQRQILGRDDLVGINVLQGGTEWGRAGERRPRCQHTAARQAARRCFPCSTQSLSPCLRLTSRVT